MRCWRCELLLGGLDFDLSLDRHARLGFDVAECFIVVVGVQVGVGSGIVVVATRPRLCCCQTSLVTEKMPEFGVDDPKSTGRRKLVQYWASRVQVSL